MMVQVLTIMLIISTVVFGKNFLKYFISDGIEQGKEEKVKKSTSISFLTMVFSIIMLIILNIEI